MNTGTPSVTMETTPITCMGCKTPFTGFVIEELNGLQQFRIGNFLVLGIEARCLKCGRKLYLNHRDQTLEKMSLMYAALLKQMGIILE